MPEILYKGMPKAVSLYHTVQVIHILRDREGKITKDVKEEHFQDGNLKEKIIYYYTPLFSISFLDKIISNKMYTRLYRKAIKRIHKGRRVFPTYVRMCM